MNYNYKNIIWIDRGILIIIIDYINKTYYKLLDKIIIINNKYYRQALKILFPNLKFSKFLFHNNNNFYFNIFNIIYNKDIIIDYLHNYNKYIPTYKICFVPWNNLNNNFILFKY